MGPLTRLIRQGIFTTALLPLVTAAMPARAQTLISPGTFTNRLTQGDLDRMNAAATQLAADRSIGAVKQWRNPNSKNAGSVKLLSGFETRGMPCWRMGYTIRFQESGEQHDYFLNWCKTAAGEWKMVEDAPRR